MAEKNPFISGLIAKMSIDQKIGALLTLGFAGTLVRPHIYDYILKYHCGGLRLTPHARTFGSYVDPRTGKKIADYSEAKSYRKGIEAPTPTPSGYRAILAHLQEIAMNRPLGLPLHFSFDQEGGSSADYNFGGVNIFPKPMGLRATGDRRLAYAVGLAVARQSRAVGFNWIHSPVLDINVNPANPEICTRAYSDRVEEVITYAEQTCRGLKEGGLIATGKHFPGRGDSACDAHYELPVITVDRETMLARELLPYRVLIEKGLLPAIMIAHSIYPAFDEEHVATVSKRILTGLLREELGFEGVITTDSMTMGAIANKYGVANACAMALEAGADLVLMKAENRLVEETFTTIRRFVAEGRIGEEELDAKVYRVLNLKYQYGLFHPWSFPSEKPEEVIADEGILTLSRTVARRSVLIARDRRGSLPLKRDQRLLLIEQATKTPNDLYWHPGTLYKYCLSYNRNVAYLETAHVHDEDDRRRIAEALPEFDTVVVTNFYRRDLLCNNETVRWLAQDPARRVIVVTNTPYELSIPVEADTVIVTFATSPRNLEVVAGVLFGQIVPEGEWPVAYRLPD